MVKRGGPWSREEDILALSLYAKRGVVDDKHSDVIELSHLTGRPPGSVASKLANFWAVETERRHGLKHFASMDQAVYSEFKNRSLELATEVERARAAYRSNFARVRTAAGVGGEGRPRWVFQAREFEGGGKAYPLYEELPRVLKRDDSRRIVHWKTAEHRYTPFAMKDGDGVLLFQGATRDYATRGFYGSAVICNLNGKCEAPIGERGSHRETNRHNRAVGVDLKYLNRFREPILPSIQPNSRLTNKNLQKLIAGGREGSAQETVFAISDEDWTLISAYFDTNLGPIRGGRQRRAGSKGGGGWRTIDPERKAKIEASAVRLTRMHFEDQAYVVTSVETDNLGWDLEAGKNDITLHLEVKGLSGSEVSIELTPNEYKYVRAKPANYRICIVTEALRNPSLRVFSYSDRSGNWEDEGGDTLSVREITGARMFKP